MIDYALKKQVLDNGCVSQTNKLRKANYLTWVYETTGDLDAMTRAVRVLDHIDYKQYTKDEEKEAKRVLDAHYQRTCRLKNKIEAYTTFWARIKYGDCVFLTLTFNDKTLATTSAETRRRYVARFLSNQCPNYVANIDYGGKRGREHYHAVILCDTINYKEWHQYGAIKAKKYELMTLLVLLELLSIYLS